MSARRPGAEPWRYPRRIRRPRKDLGPAATSRRLREPDADDAFALSVIDVASIAAEEAVHPFVTDRTEPPIEGLSFVRLVFRDDVALATLRPQLRDR